MVHVTRFVLVMVLAVATTASVCFADESERRLDRNIDTLVAAAIKLMDSGRYEESRSLLRQVRTMAPQNVMAVYEYGFSYRLEGIADSAIKYYRLASEMPGTLPFYVAAYGSLLDESKDTLEAQRVFNQGIERYPNSFHLYHERGVLNLRLGHTDSAIADFQKAIEVNPEYAPSYLRCAEAQFEIGENTFWGMIEGEIFMNLEPESERSRDFALRLAKVYNENIKIDNGKVAVSFCKDASQKEDGAIVHYSKSRFEVPYGLNGYEMPIAYAASAEKELTPVSLVTIRLRFLALYDNLKVDSTYGPNVLFDYQRKVRDAGHELPYNVWIMERAVPELAKRYIAKYQKEWDAFNVWRKDNPLVVNHNNVFLRKKYR